MWSVQCSTKRSPIISLIGIIFSLQEVTLENWNSTRFTPLPEHLTLADFTFRSYDNLHCFCGHLRALFKVMKQATPMNAQKAAFFLRWFQAITEQKCSVDTGLITGQGTVEHLPVTGSLAH